jgi:hypothetical protein
LSSLKTNLNVSPYFDDYDEDASYHRILFRPRLPVQARELIQLQTILQKQVERFGDWAFKNGDIVSGCVVTDVPVVPFVRLSDLASNGSTYDVLALANTLVVSNSSNLTARVLYAKTGRFEVNYPDTNVVYLKYINTGVAGQKTFGSNERLNFLTMPRSGVFADDLVAAVNTYANSVANTFTTGNAHGISVSEGVVYLNGNFVKVVNSVFGIVNAYGTYAGNTVVGFTLDESIVTETQDPSLLDNALGYPNRNAPGAHRLKLLPTLTAVSDADLANTEINPLVVYNFGTMVVKDTESQVQSVIGDAIAKQRYEESGNFVVNPFVVDTVTGGVANTTIGVANASTVLARVNPGVGYVQGRRVELLNTSYVNMRRGVDVAVDKLQRVTFNYGGYMLLREVAGVFDFTGAETVTLYDAPQRAVSTRVYASLNPTGNVIGTASARCFSFSSGIQGTAEAQYALHVFNVRMNSGYSIGQVKSVYRSGATKAVGDLVGSGVYGSGSTAQLYAFGASGIKNLRDEDDNNYTNYVYRTKQTATLTNTGLIVVTLPASATGGTDVLPYGTGVLTDLQAAKFIVSLTANGVSDALAGSVSIYNTSNTVIGSGTSFTGAFSVGDVLSVGGVNRIVTNVANATSLTVDAPFGANATGQTYVKAFSSGKIIPMQRGAFGSNSYVQVTNTTSFTVNVTLPPSTALGVTVAYDVLRTQTTPAQKVINKNRFIKLNTTSNPNGPWCLGVVDVHALRAVYGSAAETYTTSGTNLTSRFTVDTGQRDTHYGLAYLYPKSGFNTKATPYLLVQLDYFTANTSPGLGFFTVESYPIDDVSASNTSAIQTSEIPLYVTSGGVKVPLRDVVDFRVITLNTANNTGAVDTANSSQVTTAIGYATVNPSSTVAYSIPGSGLNTPSYGENFEANYSYYLPRRDMIYVTPDGSLRVKEGTSSTEPQTPLSPENVMPIAIINVPAYPSLSMDQAAKLTAVNGTGRSLMRDTRTTISSSAITDRRFTMRDIGKLEARITNLEYYAQLSMLEKRASDMTVTDAYGLDRYKNGIFVDPFSDFSSSDVSNPEFSMAIDPTRGVGRPRYRQEVIRVEFSNSASTATRTDSVMTLPYVETRFLVQQYATKYRSAALVAFAWNGTVTLIPSYDNHVDTVNGGAINVVQDNSKPLKDFANGPFGVTWGDWRINQTVTSNTVVNQVTKTVSVYAGTATSSADSVTSDYGIKRGSNTSVATAGLVNLLEDLGYSPDDYVIGKLSWTRGTTPPSNLVTQV